MTALMHAAADGHVNVLTTLIKNKADVSMLTKVHVHVIIVHTCVPTTLYVIIIILYSHISEP